MQILRFLALRRYSVFQATRSNLISLRSEPKAFRVLAAPFSTQYNQREHHNGFKWGRNVALLGAGIALSALVQPFGFQGDCAEKEKEGCEKCEVTCLRKMDKEEEAITKANSELEKVLKEKKERVRSTAEASLRIMCDASEMIKKFMESTYCALVLETLDSPEFEKRWCKAATESKKRCEMMKDAKTKTCTAWEALCHLKEVIKRGRACKYTSCNPLLVTMEETVRCTEMELMAAKAKLDCLQQESLWLERYANAVEDFRRDLKAEKESLLGDKCCIDTLMPQECDMILTHAYKKLARIQKELYELQSARANNDSSYDSTCPPARKSGMTHCGCDTARNTPNSTNQGCGVAAGDNATPRAFGWGCDVTCPPTTTCPPRPGGNCESCECKTQEDSCKTQ